MSDRLAVLPQYLLPKQALTALAGKFASAQAGRITTAAAWKQYVANFAQGVQSPIEVSIKNE